MDDQKNFFTAMFLSGLVLLGYWFLVGKPTAERARAQAALNAEQSQTTQVLQAEEIRPVESREVLVSRGDRIKIDSPSFTGSFLTTGSRFDDITLKDYDKTLDPADGFVSLLSPEGAESSAYIMDNWTNLDGGTGANTPWARLSGNTLTPSTPIVLGYESNGLSFERTISLDDKFLITLSDKVTNTSSDEKEIIRKGVARQHTLPEGLTNFFILQEGPISIVDNKYHDMKYKGLSKKGSYRETGESGWVGLTDKYWLLGSIAPQGKAMTADYTYRTINDQEVYEVSYGLNPVTLTAGTTIESVGHIYVGAKERTLLKSYEKDLGIAQMERAIDWGFLGLIVKPISWSLSKLGQLLGNYGLGILALTLVIKILLFPLFNKQYEMQAKMKKLQPKLKKIQELYKDDRMRLQQEMMGMYKKEGANPAAGCLVIIPTIFVFFALYKSVFINIDLRHQPFFGWIKDLSAKDPLSILNGFGAFPWDAIPLPFLSFFAIGPLALMYGVSMASIYTLTPQNPGAGEQAEMMAKMMKIMPWLFMFILAPFAAGLLLYWVWNNVLSFAQQYYITRKFKVDTPVDAFFRKITGKNKPSTSE